MIRVLYGSETGTARELAERVSAWLRLCGASSAATEMDSAALWDEQEVVVLVVSTTGDGEAPRGMRVVWQRLLGKECARLPQLRYALYGLGDARYEGKFNAAARRLDARLRQLGATPVVDRVLADACASGGHVAPLFSFYSRLAAALGIRNAPELPDSADELAAPAPLRACRRDDDGDSRRERAAHIGDVAAGRAAHCLRRRVPVREWRRAASQTRE